MNGKLIGGALVSIALIAGAALYYFQVYHFYDEVAAEAEMRLTLLDGTPDPILAEQMEAIDATSSPIRFRACFQTPHSLGMLTETYIVYQDAEPRTAPGWFDCFDAEQIAADLAIGDAVAFLGEENITYGIDRVIAVYSDGRAVAWHQINACGERVFDGDPPPAGCPPPPPRN